MGTIEFYSGIADVPSYVVRLLRKAHAKGARVAVVAAPPMLRRLDTDLWAENPRDFVPHVRVDPGAGEGVSSRLDRTPIWLVERAAAARGCNVLVNLRSEAVGESNDFARLIEIVSTEPEDRRAGRTRWRNYESMGHAIVHHAFDGKAADGPREGSVLS